MLLRVCAFLESCSVPLSQQPHRSCQVTMRFLFLLILPLTSRVAAVANDCNATLPWYVNRWRHPHLTEDQVATLLQCPENLNGCSDSPTFCNGYSYLLTCSCAENCAVYGDCCWEVELTDTGYYTPKPASTCVSVNVEDTYFKSLYMVTGCRSSWPQDEVRDACQNADKYNDTFYITPTTSLRGVTYYNGFCALCNYDMDEVVFWNTSFSERRRSIVVSVPDVVEENPTLYLRPCTTLHHFEETCSLRVSTKWARNCETYFAPVTDVSNRSNTVYKNVYCALCNGEGLASLSCAPLRTVRNFTLIPYLRSGMPGPNLVQLLRPVTSSQDCRYSQGDKCYIPSLEYRYNNHSSSNGSDSNPSAVKHLSLRQSLQVYFTIVCLSLSLLCLALKAVVYVLYKTSRGFSSKCTLCLSCTLLFSHLLFLLANSFPLPRNACKVSAVFLHYGFLAAFFWTTVMSFDIWKGVAVAKMSRGRKRTFYQYCLVAWGSPLCLVLTSIAIDWTAPSSPLAPGYGRGSCWLTNAAAHALFFLTPMTLLLIVGCALYVHIVIYVRRTAKRAAGFEYRGGAQQSQMGLFVKLAFIMGATWGVGFAWVFVDSVVTDVIVIVLIGLQGVYLFFGFKDYRYFLSSFRDLKTLERTKSSSSATTNTDMTAVDANPNGRCTSN